MEDLHMSIFKKNTEPLFSTESDRMQRDTVIGSGTLIEGTISSKENVCIDGLFKGKILSEGKVVIGETGKVEADINADTILMCGEVHGNIVATTKLEISSHGKLKGNIKTGSLIIAEGVIFEGNCQMVWNEQDAHGDKDAMGKDYGEKIF
jgi:cytoskeletal protein CcmA (bactofilin family)